MTSAMPNDPQFVHQIALFGTSADPPTLAHQAILVWLATQFDLVAVWAADNPFKPHQTPLSHRQAMLQLLVADLQTNQPQIQLCPELSDWRTLYTVNKARQLWPTAELTLVVGTDVIAKMPDWYQIGQLLPQVQLLVVQRPDVPAPELGLERLRQLGAHFTLANFTGPALSSTALRQHYSTDGISPSIASYIQQEKLYPWDSPLPNPR
jgi:nicotinate-nucleotide adenylyltransferase